LSTAFPGVDFSGCTAFNGNTTLLSALSLKGGSTLCAKKETLLRAAAAAFLNSLRVNYPLTTDQVQQMVGDAIASGNASLIISTAGALDSFNNGGGPNGIGDCKDANGNGLPCKGVFSPKIQPPF